MQICWVEVVARGLINSCLCSILRRYHRGLVALDLGEVVLDSSTSHAAVLQLLHQSLLVALRNRTHASILSHGITLIRL